MERNLIKFGILLYMIMTIMPIVAGEIIIDDFHNDSELWEYYSSAYRNYLSEFVALTDNVNDEVGIIWLNRDIKTPFIAEFRYRAGGGSGADGFVLMFYKNRNYTPDKGGRLGFQSSNSYSPGYGIEFDNFGNDEFSDPSSNHIAIIKDSAGNHLLYRNDERTEDYQWHQAKVIVGDSSIDIYVNGERVLDWKGYIDRNYGGFGFGGATGGSNNWHLIDDIRITTIEPNITIDTPNGGENWTYGTIKRIKWSYTGNPGSYVKIELLKGGILNTIITSSTPIDNGYYDWFIPTFQPAGNDYNVRITSTTNSAYADTSDNNFAILANIIGDINGDKKITANDALLYLRYAVGEDISPYQISISDDVTCDGKITVADALKVLRKAVGQDVNLECGGEGDD